MSYHCRPDLSFEKCLGMDRKMAKGACIAVRDKATQTYHAEGDLPSHRLTLPAGAVSLLRIRTRQEAAENRTFRYGHSGTGLWH